MSLAFSVVGILNTHIAPVKVSRLEVIRGAFRLAHRQTADSKHETWSNLTNGR